MKTLVLNCGSSSIKYQFIDTNTKTALAKGVVERIGMSGAVLTHQRYDGDKIKVAGEILDHKIAIEYVLGVMLSKNHGVNNPKNHTQPDNQCSPTENFDCSYYNRGIWLNQVFL